ncbi:MAG TPA: hypothetical protein PKH93_02900 [Chitinophagales bacterium]|nr:hypothetical protein [Chitinophagales bacterium]
MNLINNITELMDYVDVNKNIEWITFKRHIVKAETQVLQPIIGQQQYDSLITALSGTPTVNELSLIDKCRWVVSSAAMWYALPSLNVMVSDMGVMQTRSSESTAAPATQWSYREVRRNYLLETQTFAEDLYRFLQTERNNYSAWAGSSADSEYNELLLRNNKELGRYLNTADSVRTYVGLVPFIRTATISTIIPIVGQVMVDTLLAALKANGAVSDVVLLDYIRRALAWQALYDALPFINIMTGTTSVTIAIMEDGMHTHTPADIEQLKRHAEQQATNAIAVLSNYYNMLNPPSEPTCFLDNSNKPDFWI